MKRVPSGSDRAFALTLLAFVLVISSGCRESGSDNGGLLNPPAADVAGYWVFTADQADPPRTTNCNGGLASLAFVFCPTIALPIAQDGSVFSGTGTEPHCGNTYSLLGTVSGNDVTGTVLGTGPAGTTRANFSGFMTDPDSMTTALTTMTLDGFSGTCNLDGGYAGARTPIDPQLTLVAYPVAAAPVPALDPTGQTYYSTIYGQLVDATASTPLAGWNITLVTSAGLLARCSTAANCDEPLPGPLTVTTDSAGLVYVRLAVTATDPPTVDIEAVSGTINAVVSVDNPLGQPDADPQAVLRIVPDSPADASSGSVEVAFISESMDPDGDPITCHSWFVASTIGPSFSLFSNDASFSRIYDAEQLLSVVLRVSSDPGAATVCDDTTVFSPNIDVQDYLICTNTEPSAEIAVTSQDDQPSVTTFSFSGSASTDAESNIAHYQWDCGNGNEPTGEEIACMYARGSVTRFFTVELVVTDRGNGESGCTMESTPASVTVVVPRVQ